MVATINRMTAADAAIRGRVTDFVTRSWLGLGHYRDSDIAGLIARVVPVVLGAQRQTSTLTSAYLAQIVSLMAGGSAAPQGVRADEVTGAALRGVDPAEVYRRPAIQVYTDLAAGKSYNDAVKSGLRRLVNIAMTDLQLAKTHTARRVLAGNDRVVGYRRTLTGSENCAICRVAATQRYHKDGLLPIHPGCDCGVAPIIGDTDPGHVIDQEGLDNVHAAVAERFGESAANGRDLDYRNLIVVENHGEIGPLLTIKGQHFDGPSDIH